MAENSFGQPFVYKIMIYPIKSLPPKEVGEARVTDSGSLMYDRLYAIVDSKGRFVNGKREKKIHLLRARYALKSIDRVIVHISACGDEETFELDSEIERFERWLTRFFGYEVKVVKNTDTGFPDDIKYNGPTITSTATLSTVSSWFEDWDILQARLRFRANIEVGGVDAFWEDRLYAGPGKAVVFRVGDVVMEGRNISKRCVVPSRDPFTGKETLFFQKIFIEKRPRIRLLENDHNYRACINTIVRPGQGGKVIRILDRVEILGLEPVED